MKLIDADELIFRLKHSHDWERGDPIDRDVAIKKVTELQEVVIEED